MLVVRATKKLLDRLGPVTLESGQTSTTRLGDWYASAWAWRPQVALFVSEATLFPILMPLAPAATLLARFPDGLAQALAAHDVPEAFITQELSRMQEVRLGPATLESGQTSTTRLGDWYASAWVWRPQVALFVSEATLFPILMPLTPAATLLARFPDGLAQALAAHDVPEAFITQELSRMQDVRLGKTASRSALGIMNEFTFLAQTMRGDTTTDLTDLARWLARTPCSPLFKRHGSPDRELRALVEAADVVPSE